MGELSDPFAHFGTEQPPDGPAGYRELAHGCHTEVWLDTDGNLVHDVVREYEYMRYEQLCEAEFSTYAQSTLFRRDPRFSSYQEAREWRTERMIQLVTKPTSSTASRWRPHPVTIEADVPDYDFDIRTDSQYTTVRKICVHSQRPNHLSILYNRVQKGWQHHRASSGPGGSCCSSRRLQSSLTQGTTPQAHGKEVDTEANNKYSALWHYIAWASIHFWYIKLRQQKQGHSVFPSAWTWPGYEITKVISGNLLTTANMVHFMH